VFIWLTAFGVAAALLMVGGLLALIMVNGLGQFWPARLWEVELRDGRHLIGQRLDREPVPHSRSPEYPRGRRRIRFRVGNQDVFSADHVWIETDRIAAQRRPADLVALERLEWGPLYGRVQALYAGELILAKDDAAWRALGPALERAEALRRQIDRVEQDVIADIDQQLEVIRLQREAFRIEEGPAADEAGHDRALQTLADELGDRYRRARVLLDALQAESAQQELAVALSDGQVVRVPVSTIMRALRPNELGPFRKAVLYCSNLWAFLSGEPREANTEGGIFPAIYGTVVLVLIMTLMVMPFGILAAVYLREYARQGSLVRLVRIAVNNLAGVPSIVFGVFGLGFFIYGIGGTLDHLFYREALPSPTIGTGGLLWAALTLALLTLPVVIVATEEGLSAVPRDFRDGSIALGATKIETIWHVVLPCALPGILTGLILAMARAAGEVAPLMLTGVVKLAPSLPLDSHFPFLHLDSKFMHLGFHIYDVGFQAPNVEAAKAMVYMTTLTLIVVVIVLNLVAVRLRTRLQRRSMSAVV